MQFELSLPIEIRPLRTGDLDGLEWDAEQAVQAEYMRKTLAQRGDDVVLLLAFASGRPVGSLGIDFGRKADEGIVHLWAFGVLPALQRHGIGTALMHEAERLVASSPREPKLIEVGVDEWNAEAAALYRRLGYREGGTERGSKGERIILLRRSISDLG